MLQLKVCVEAVQKYVTARLRSDMHYKVNNDYSKLEEITVKSQIELDAIPDDFAGRIYIEFGTYLTRAVVSKRYCKRVVALENSSVEAHRNSSVVACENSSVEAWENSSVEAWENSSVVAYGNSSVVAWGNSSVVAWENSSVEAHGNSSVEAHRNSSVVAYGNSSILACGNNSIVVYGNSSVVVYGNSSVVAYGNSSVEAHGNSSVEAHGNSSVVAYGNSSVVAWENSSVVAYENSSVVALGNSSVVANANVQVVNQLSGGKIEVTGNARIVYMPKTIEEYCAFYGIEHNKKTGKFFKCVHKREDGVFCSDQDTAFEYKIGQKATADYLDKDPTEDCGHGIHISYLTWALDYGKDWDDLAVLEVEADLSDIILPHGCPGNVRCVEVTVLKEVPLEECGIYGKILAARRQNLPKAHREF